MKKEYINTLLQMEYDLSLNNECFNDFYYWQYYRTIFFNNVKTQVDNLDEKNYVTNKSKVSILIRAFNVNTKSKYYISSKIKKSDYLILCNRNRKLIDNRYICSYTWDMSNKLNGSKIYFEHASSHHLTPTPEKQLIYLDKEYFKERLFYRIHKKDSLKKTFLEKIANSLIKVHDYLTKNGINFNIDYYHEAEFLWEYYLEHRYLKKSYKNIIYKVSPKVIFETCYYDFETMIINEVASELGIKTIELQHGLISYEHFAYNSYDNLNNKTIPNYLLTFGEYWNNVAKYPIRKENVIPFGFAYFDKQKKNAKPINKFKEKNIVFLSQWTIGSKLSKLALETACKIKEDYHIIYKLHPGEYQGYQNKYKDIIDNPNITLVSDEYNLYDIFASSVAVVGVYSTAIFEALGFGLKCFLYNIPGIENVKQLYDYNMANIIDSADDIISGLNETADINTNTEMLWKHCDLKEINKMLEIINK